MSATTDHRTPPAGVRPPREQVVYANLLLLGVWLGILVLLVTYTLYVSGVLAPHTPVTTVESLWGAGVGEYAAATHAPHGWGWTSFLGTGDYLNYLGFAVLGLTTLFCYVMLVFRFARTGDRKLLVICALEILVLGVAASGILGGGGH